MQVVRKPRIPKLMLYIDQIPESYGEFISQIIDVKGDENCGFRVVSSFMRHGEDNWAQVRGDLLAEIHKNEDIYLKMHKDQQVVEQMCRSLDSYVSPASIENWMTFSEM